MTRATADFSDDKFGVDVLKMEVPIQMEFVAGTKAFKGTAAYTKEEALQLFRKAAEASGKPFHLSFGRRLQSSLH